MTDQGPSDPPTTPPDDSGHPDSDRPGGAPGPLLPSLAKTEPVSKPLHLMHIWQFQAFRDLLLVASVLAIVWIGYELRAVTIPLLVALLLAYLFEPLIARLSQHPKISRTSAVSSVLIVFGGGLLIVVVLALPLVIGQTTRLLDHIVEGGLRRNLAKLEVYLPEPLEEDYRSFINRLPAGRGPALVMDAETPAGHDIDVTEPEDPEADADGAAEETDAAEADATGDEAEGGAPSEQEELPGQSVDADRLAEAIAAEVARQLAGQEDAEATPTPTPEPPPRPVPAAAGEDGDLDQAVLGLARRGVETGVAIVGSIIGLGFMVFLVFFYLFFFSVWYPQVVAFGEKLIPEKNKPRSLELLKKMDNVVAGFVRGRIVISIIMGVMLAIGWMICGVPYAIPVGLLVGVFCAVPYLGGVGVPLAIALLFYGQLDNPPDERMAWWGILLWPTLVFAIVQVVEGYVLTPVIAGKATNLDPVTILVAVLAGGSVLGVYGMLLAIPVAACLKIIISEVLLPRIRAWMRGEIADPLPIERE